MFILPLSLVIGKLNACFNYKNKKITITMENKNNFDLYDEENIEEEEEIENQMRDISLSGFKLTSNEKTLLNTSTSTLVPLPSTSNLEDPGNSTVIPNSTVVPLNKDRKIEHPNQFGDLKTTNHLTKMNSNIMQSIAEIFNAEILKFAKRVNAEYPTVPVEGMLAIWCKQQDMPLSTFEVLEGKEEVYNNIDNEDDEPIPVVKKAPPKKKVVKKVVKKPVEAEVRDDEDVEQENEVENGAVEITSDAEDDRRSSDEEVEHAKPVKKAAAKKKSPAAKKKKNQAKNVNICMLKVKMRVQNVLQLSKEKETTVANINLKLLKKSSSFINQSFHYLYFNGQWPFKILILRKIESLILKDGIKLGLYDKMVKPKTKISKQKFLSQITKKPRKCDIKKERKLENQRIRKYQQFLDILNLMWSIVDSVS